MKSIVTTTACLLALLVSSVASGQPVQVTTLTDTLHASGGMTIGPDGNLYVADWVTETYDQDTPYGTEVHRVFPDGTHEVFADGFDGPIGLVFAADSNLYVSQLSRSQNFIQRVSPDGVVSGYYTSGLQGPMGMVAEADGSLIVATCGGGGAGSPGEVIRITPTRVPTSFSRSALFACPGGLTLGSDGNFYVTNAWFGDGRIIKITPEGNATELARVPGTVEGIGGFLTFANDRLYVVAPTDYRIYQVTLEGEVSALAGTGFPGLTDGAAFEASFFRPFGIAASVTGDTLFVNDSGDINSTTVHPNVIRMITGVHNAQTSPVANEEAGEVPAGFVLAQNYPNPFNPSTSIRFNLPQAGYVALTVYDLFGREIATLVDGQKPAGSHEVAFDAGHLASGTYLYRLTAGSFVEMKRMILLK